MQTDTSTIIRRGKAKIKNKKTIADVYKYYKTVVVKGSAYDISFKEFKKIFRALAKNCWDYMIYDSGEVMLDHGLGSLRIKKIKTNYNKPKVDSRKTKELGKTVYFLNLHTNSDYVRTYWNKNVGVTVGKRRPYSFSGHRKRVREFSKLFGSGQKDYFA